MSEKTFFVRFHASHDYSRTCGNDLIDAATKLYEKMLAEQTEDFMVGVIGEGYKEGTSPDIDDNIFYFSNSVIAANAGDYNFSKQLDEYANKVIKDEY